ncbi:hypothetical protein KDA_09240 [Dictyobacter alpinus]|uniref:Uncharacterized protein n=1 Tax=Dictyobacter alpinus TaxID=2014873 RepID=A0A402B253_9CHLR|nr:hypothetical protein KDA_09240 [Dictyobacter alpinus]
MSTDDEKLRIGWHFDRYRVALIISCYRLSVMSHMHISQYTLPARIGLVNGTYGLQLEHRLTPP